MEQEFKTYRTYHPFRYDGGSVIEEARDFVREEPLLIRVEDCTYAVVMRTPGDEVAHAAGFCLSEGLIESPEDLASIGFCSDLDDNSVTVRLAESRKPMVADKLDRQGFLSQTSCGICGREMIEDLTAHLKVAANGAGIEYGEVFDCFDVFLREQRYYTRTRGTHAVMLFDGGRNVLAKAEDVGRHNAMDKSVGAVLLGNRISDVKLAVLSSRISFEMIQKAARAGIPILISKSNPTTMAVELGRRLNMTLICLDKGSGFIAPCGAHRIDRQG
jgi:FdhD protein